MDLNEAKQVANEIARSLLESKSVNATLHKMARVLSYLISEQEGRDKLLSAMNTMHEQLWGGEKKTGLVHQLDEMQARSLRNGKLMWSVLGSLLSVIALEVLRLALTKH